MPSSAHVEYRRTKDNGEHVYRIRYGQYTGICVTTADGHALFYPRRSRLGETLSRNAWAERAKVAQCFVEMNMNKPQAH